MKKWIVIATCRKDKNIAKELLSFDEKDQAEIILKELTSKYPDTDVNIYENAMQ